MSMFFNLMYFKSVSKSSPLKAKQGFEPNTHPPVLKWVAEVNWRMPNSIMSSTWKLNRRPRILCINSHQLQTNQPRIRLWSRFLLWEPNKKRELSLFWLKNSYCIKKLITITPQFIITPHNPQFIITPHNLSLHPTIIITTPQLLA